MNFSEIENTFASEIEMKRPSRRESDKYVESMDSQFIKNKGEPSARVDRTYKVKGFQQYKAKDSECHVPVLTDIMEKNLDSFGSVLPPIKETLHPSRNISCFKSRKKKKSLFYEEMKNTSRKETNVDHSQFPFTDTGSMIIDGSGLGLPNCQTEAQKIHKENLDKLAELSAEDIFEEKKNLLEMLGPDKIKFLESRRKTKGFKANKTTCDKVNLSGDPNEKILKMSTCANQDAVLLSDFADSRKISFQIEPELPSSASTDICEEELPIHPEDARHWIHMKKVEKEKLAWMTMLPKPRTIDAKTEYPARFGFDGNLLQRDGSIPTQHGLHHHASEPEVPGYTIEELFLLARSSVQSQRISALNTLAAILENYWNGRFDSCLDSALLSTMLKAALVPLLRWALDDTALPSIAAAVSAIHHLIVCKVDELCLDLTYCWFDVSPYFFVPHNETDEDVNEMTDTRIIELDVVKGLFRMDILPRFTYIVNVLCPPVAVCQLIVITCIRLARHSKKSAKEVLESTELMNTIFQKFLPVSWSLNNHQELTSDNYLCPMPSALKLVRVIAASDRALTVDLIGKWHLVDSLKCYLTIDPSGNNLKAKDVHSHLIETLRTWHTLLSYGLTTEIFLDLQPIILRLFQYCQTISINSNVEQNNQNFEFVTHLLSTLERVVAIASEENSLISSSCQNVIWNAVEPALKIGELCLQRWIREFCSQTNLSGRALLATGLDFMGFFYGNAKGKSKMDTSVFHDSMNIIIKEYFLPCLQDQAFQNLASHLCSSSLLLCSDKAGSMRDTPVLPTLGCVMWKADIIPLFGNDGPFPLITAMTSFIVNCFEITQNCKNAESESLTLAASLVLNNDHIQRYLKEFIKAEVKSHWFNKCETLFVYHLLRLFVYGNAKCEVLYKVALKTLLCFTSPMEFYSGWIMKNIIFNPSYLSQNQEEKELTDIANFYSEFFLADDIEQSTCLEQKQSSRIKSLICHANAPVIFDIDWVFRPILTYYNLFKKRGSLGDSKREVSRGIKNCLNVVLLNLENSSLFSDLPFSALYCYLCMVYLIDGTIFFQKEINQLLSSCFRDIVSHQFELKFEKQWKNIPNFEQLYKELLIQFEAVAYGDETFSNFIFFPLQRCCSAKRKTMFFSEYADALRCFNLPLNKLLLPIQNFLKPHETNESVLEQYFCALESGNLTEEKSQLLFLMAVHHLHCFIFDKNNEKSNLHKILKKSMENSKAKGLVHIRTYTESSELTM